MRIGVLVFGRLNKCVEHYDNIINSIGKEHTIDFFYHPTTLVKIY